MISMAVSNGSGGGRNRDELSPACMATTYCLRLIYESSIDKFRRKQIVDQGDRHRKISTTRHEVASMEMEIVKAWYDMVTELLFFKTGVQTTALRYESITRRRERRYQEL